MSCWGAPTLRLSEFRRRSGQRRVVMASLADYRRRLPLFAQLALAVALAVPISLFILRRLPTLFTRQTLMKATVGFLVLLDVAYILIVLTAVVGVAVIGFLLYRSRRRGNRRPSLVRGFVVCFSCLVSATLADGIAAGWRAWSERLTPLTYGISTPSASQVSDPSENAVVNVTVVGESRRRRRSVRFMAFSRRNCCMATRRSDSKQKLSRRPAGETWRHARGTVSKTGC